MATVGARGLALVLCVACGSRTELDRPTPARGGTDAAVSVDAAAPTGPFTAQDAAPAPIQDATPPTPGPCPPGQVCMMIFSCPAPGPCPTMCCEPIPNGVACQGDCVLGDE
jgi:hypothetical protein